MVVVEPAQTPFADVLSGKLNGMASQGVQVSSIEDDPTPFKQVYNPTHPDADANGMVSMPNVDILKEMVDMISATRSYEANVTALNASKAMFSKSLEIGRS
jgi:flagellar basal-body rod protein FlgC